jgi:hypothetical protein
MSMPLVRSAPVFSVVSVTKPCGESQSDPCASRLTRPQKNASRVSTQRLMIVSAPIPEMNFLTLMSK